MDIIIREIEENDYLSVLSLGNNELGCQHNIENVVTHLISRAPQIENFSIGGEIIKVDTTDFNKVDFDKCWFSIVDIVAVLTDSDYQAARKYWKVLKGRIEAEGNELVTNCYQLKMQAPDGKMRLTDVADTEQVLRLVQSIPSKKAEPFMIRL